MPSPRMPSPRPVPSRPQDAGGGPIRLDGAVVVVTGATSGIGRATTLLLASRGACVVAVARRTGELERLVEVADRHPGTVEAAPADVTDAQELRRIADEAVARHGRLDAWVNNAAVNVYGPIDGAPLQDLHRLFAVNLGGYLNGMRAALPYLRERGSGVIVNVSSVLAQAPSPHQAAYVASKHAIHGLTTAVRQEVERDGIHVCEVLPGPVDTPLFAEAANHRGRDVVPPEPITDPARIAWAVAASITRPRRTRVVGLQNRIMVLGARLAPNLAEAIARRMIEREHFGSRPTPATSGNLHEPSPRPGAIRGGWKQQAVATRVLAAASTTLQLVRGR